MLVLLIRKFEKNTPPPHNKITLPLYMYKSVTLHITCIARQSDENNHVCLSPCSSHVSIARYNICQMYSMCVSPCIHVQRTTCIARHVRCMCVCLSVCHHVHHTHNQTCQMHMCLSTCYTTKSCIPRHARHMCVTFTLYTTCMARHAKCMLCVSPCIPHV